MDNLASLINYHEDAEYLAFLEERKKYDLTSSEFGAALGLDKYRTRQKLWRAKTNQKTLAEQKESNFQDFNCNYGRTNEDNGVQRFEEKVPLYDIKKSPTLRIDYGFVLDSRDLLINYELGSSPDRTLHDKTNGEIVATLEVKTPAPGVGFYGTALKDAQVYPCAKEGRIPAHHLVQMIGQMRATNVSQAYYQVWTPRQGDATIQLIVTESFWENVWQNVLLKELFIFLDWVRDQVKPPRLLRELGPELATKFIQRQLVLGRTNYSMTARSIVPFGTPGTVLGRSREDDEEKTELAALHSRLPSFPALNDIFSGVDNKDYLLETLPRSLQLFLHDPEKFNWEFKSRSPDASWILSLSNSQDIITYSAAQGITSVYLSATDNVIILPSQVVSRLHKAVNRIR